MVNPRSNSPAPSQGLISSPPGSFRGRSFGTSLPRHESTARLASIPSHTFSTPPGRQTPNQAAANGEDESGRLSPLPGAGSHNAGPGISALAAALSNSIGTSPPRFGTPPVRPLSPAASASAQLLYSSTPTNYGSFDARSRPSIVGAYEDPEIVKRHLVQPGDGTSPEDNTKYRKASDSSSKGKQPAERSRTRGDDNDEEFSSLRLQGGDITRPIYKWTEEIEQRNKVQRSKSFSEPRPEPENEILDINTIKVPGGFRRNFLRRAIRDSSANSHELEFGEGPGSRAAQRPRLLTSSFLEFLSLYGHFAGEELEEDDEVLKPGEYFTSGSEYEDSDYYGDEGSDEDREPMEDSALLTPSRRKRRRKVRGGSGQNSPMSAALLLLKSFVGTGVLFLPRAYLNGGMLFSNLVLLGVAALSYYCFVLLVTTRLKVEGSFGDIGGILYGKWMRQLILFSIVISQIGFVAAYIVFTSENLQAFILAVTKCKTSVPITWLIIMQMVVFLPFSLLRDIGKLGFTALIADAFIVIGLAYLFYYDIFTLSTEGLADIIMFNKKDWTLFIGTAIFTFEGIGLIIPIQESMKRPEKFPKVMFVVMIIITTLFIVMGAVSYAAYGSKTETVVLLNLPQDDKFVNAVQFLYSLAILLSTPLQIFPAIRITENALFTKSGKYNPYIKWQKNAFRFLVVALCALIAWGGADNLDKFVALVGNFACIPLVYIYPPMLHYRGVAKSALWKWSDVALCIFGFVAMAYTTSLTVMSWANSSPGGGLPSYCDTKGL
ncbi:transmembrane amino acid transporter protein-domain-containing protein [Apodospora peruviana]|uniref:Transmembrane amino acid transporter protein-domain-containing protein n=1 Tax=Apodospora peruviana TaxID=516989 RepID=A0AAE0MBR3_9PEZI|nr:transmembrane amino acid transporter protein-domain-containing protein [Apodospora peruviana]